MKVWPLLGFVVLAPKRVQSPRGPSSPTLSAACWRRRACRQMVRSVGPQ